MEAASDAIRKQVMAANSTGRAPMRSTTKPAMAWPEPEMMKKMLMSRPTSE
ncbi:hypothetical protein Y695_04798 [Hydrogenophaga sp. T4]|nr:hypothetical protein Y695_04798 [Hydrogenophaga sp. T4]